MLPSPLSRSLVVSSGGNRRSAIPSSRRSAPAGAPAPHRLLAQRGRAHVADAGKQPGPAGWHPSGCVVSYVCSLTKPADQGSVYTHIAHWARWPGGAAMYVSLETLQRAVGLVDSLAELDD